MASFPFFVGCGRSGTTLLRSMFDAHPEIAIPYESHFVVALGRAGPRKRYEREGGFAVDAFASDLLAQFAFSHWGIGELELGEALHAPPPLSYADAVRRVFALYARRQGKRRYADKTANYVLSLPLLAELFYEARFVHVLRDGRDVALSWLDTGWDFGPQTVEEAALYWRYYVQRGRRTGRDLGPRYCEIAYEWLVADPEGALRELCSFLELPYHPAMLDYFEHADELLSSMPRPGQHQSLAQPVTGGLRDWRRQMPAHDIALFESLAGSVLEELGYELSARTGASTTEA